MTCENKSGRQEAPALKNGEVTGAVLREAPKCGLCGGPIGTGPPLHFIRKGASTLEESRVCAVCFLKVVSGVKA
jgi:hypothetical protein